MTLATGKLPVALLRSVLEGLPTDREVVLGPGIGEDAAAIEPPGGTLVAATDPITLTGSGVGALAVRINANDVAVTGGRPRWFLATVLLPPTTDEHAAVALFDELRGALLETGATLVGGHTEVTAVVTQPVVVGAMLGVAERVIPTGGARPGDVLVQVGAVPIEGAAVFATEAADRLGMVDERVLDAARRAGEDPGISVVEPALAAAGAGASSLHDPTEGGLSAGLHEMAEAAGVGVVVDCDEVALFGPGAAVCAALDADPWATLASGALLATVPPSDLDAVTDALDGHEPAVIGEIVPASEPFVRTRDGVDVTRPDRDETARLL